jgi:glycosyltransferase involved in cell wall biosynthesis
MKVLLLSRYERNGSSSRVRFYQYMQHLAAQGIRVTVAPLLGNDYVEGLQSGRGISPVRVGKAYLRRLLDLLKCRDHDLLWVEGEVLPWLPAWLETILSSLKIPYVVDYDDAIFHRYDLHPNAVVCLVLGKKIDSVMRRSAMVIAGNAYLADRAKKAGAKRVEVLPSVVDLRLYNAVCRSENRRFTIGWIGSPTTAKYLQLAVPALREICAESGGCMLSIGSDPAVLDGMPVEVRTWSEGTEVSDMGCFDVGIMPLPDEPWTRGKCGYKLIQYMASRLPVIASPVGVNKEIVQHGVNGFLAGTTDEWFQSLQTLRKNPELRIKMGEAGRRIVASNYCMDVTAPQLTDLLLSAVKQ